jgi:short-chain fatty acids transporter
MTENAVMSAIGNNETQFSTMNLAIMATMLLVITLLNRAMHPAKQDVITIDPNLLKVPEHKQKPVSEMIPAECL